MKKIRSVFLILIFMVVFFTSCGSKKEYMEIKQTKSIGNNGFDSVKSESNRVEKPKKENNKIQPKIIRNVSIEMETMHFDETLVEVEKELNSVDGYIENSKITGKHLNDVCVLLNRRAYYRLRVPKENYNSFLDKVGDLGNIINKSENTENVTARYFDTDSHLKAKKIEEERLLEVLKKSEDVKDIIELEKRLADVRYEIESLTTELRRWDNLVDYATVTINIYEVYKETAIQKKPVTLLQRIQNSFAKSISALKNIFEYMVIFIIYLIPFAIVFGGLGLLIFIINKKIKLKSKEKKKVDKGNKD